MSVIPVKIKILDREYTLRVSEENKAQIIQASQALNDALKTKQQKMNIIDKQDLLSFVAFDGFFEAVSQQNRVEETQERLDKLTQVITESVKSDIT